MSVVECLSLCPCLKTSFASGIASASYNLLNQESCHHSQSCSFMMAPLDVSCEVFEKSYQIGTVCGDRGRVWISKHKPSTSRFVLKIYELEKCQEELDRIKDEIAMVRQLQHRNIIKYLASFISEEQLWIVMPLIGYTSASRLVASHFKEGLSEPILALIIKDVLGGLHYLHSKGIIHRAVKGTHILVDGTGRSLLCGFRHSASSISQGRWAKRIHSYPPEAAYNLNWASPELLKQDTDGYCDKTDIYSLGVTICELGNGKVPYWSYKPQLILVEKVYGREPFLHDMTTCRHLYENGKDSGMGESYSDYLASLSKIERKCFSPAAHSFVSACLTFDPNARPFAEKLLEHSFIRQTRKIDAPLAEMLHPVTPIDETTDLGECDGVSPDMINLARELEPQVTWDLD